MQTVEERIERARLWLMCWTAILVFGSVLLASEVVEMYQLVNKQTGIRTERR